MTRPLIGAYGLSAVLDLKDLGSIGLTRKSNPFHRFVRQLRSTYDIVCPDTHEKIYVTAYNNYYNNNERQLTSFYQKY